MKMVSFAMAMMPVRGNKGKNDKEEEVQQKKQKDEKKEKKEEKARDTNDLHKESEIRAKRAAKQKWETYSHTTQEVQWSSHHGKWVVVITDMFRTDVLKEQGRKRQKKKKKKKGGKKEKMQTMITGKQKSKNERCKLFLESPKPSSEQAMSTML